MPIPKDASVGKIIKIEMAAGKSRKQAIAIAMRRARPKEVPANKGREGGIRAAGSLLLTDPLRPRYGERGRGMRMAQISTSQGEDLESLQAQRSETHHIRSTNQNLRHRERIFSQREKDIITELERQRRTGETPESILQQIYEGQQKRKVTRA